jgi:hypothetical protein
VNCVLLGFDGEDWEVMRYSQTPGNHLQVHTTSQSSRPQSTEFNRSSNHTCVRYLNNIKRTASITKQQGFYTHHYLNVRKMCIILLPTIAHCEAVIVHYHHDLALQLHLQLLHTGTTCDTRLRIQHLLFTSQQSTSR